MAKTGKCHLEWRKQGKLTVRCNHQAPKESSKAYSEVTCGNCIYLVERDRILNDEKFRGYAESGYFPISAEVYNELVAANAFPKYGLKERDPITEQYMTKPSVLTELSVGGLQQALPTLVPVH